MIVSWEWLSQYVDLQMDHDELVDRLTMSGLNHEGTEEAYGDRAVDLEVTSNRPDCLGHLGVAREISVLFDLPLNQPQPQPTTGADDLSDRVKVDIQCPDLCYRYTARLLTGVRVGPSPDWLADRLRAIGQPVINNVVDATNYVMFECGQPLHAFDFAEIADGQIVVREALQGEAFAAIDHRNYELAPGMCVIADSSKPVALGGVMGGAESEVSDTTTEVLIEAARFSPLSVRNTARTLKLHSPSSFRFERTIDDEQIEWASRRCCELILETGGGTLLAGVVDVGQRTPPRSPIVLRLSQLPRILGIEIPTDFVLKALAALGMQVDQPDVTCISATPPSWRQDLVREVDLVEEVGRIYGFDKVPDSVSVPMAASHSPKPHRVLNTVRTVLTANGFDEAMTPSLVPEKWSEAFSPWCDKPALISSQPMLGVLEKASQNVGAVEFLRRSLVPSLLEARRINEYRSNEEIELFETAKVYLTQDDRKLPHQPVKVAVVSERDYFALKAVVDSLVTRLNAGCRLTVGEFDHPLLDINKSAELRIGDQRLGFVGETSELAVELFRLRQPATVAELDFSVLESIAILIPQHHNQSLFPAITRDFNFIVDNAVHWSKLEEAVTAAGGDLLENVVYRETFRDEHKDGSGRKRLLLSVVLRSADSTLTGEQADEVCRKIVDSCQSKVNASLVA